MIGDIVSYQNHRWVICRQDRTSQPSGAWTLLRDDTDGLRVSVTAYGGWELLARPEFVADMVLRFEGQHAVVHADEGKTVRLRIDRTKTLRPNTGSCVILGVIALDGIAASIDRANLVLENIHKFLEA